MTETISHGKEIVNASDMLKYAKGLVENPDRRVKWSYISHIDTGSCQVTMPAEECEFCVVGALWKAMYEADPVLCPKDMELLENSATIQDMATNMIASAKEVLDAERYEYVRPKNRDFLAQEPPSEHLSVMHFDLTHEELMDIFDRAAENARKEEKNDTL